MSLSLLMNQNVHKATYFQLKQAAKVLSSILTENGINHAFIGGFALQSFGHVRFTDDIDVEVDVEHDEVYKRLVCPVMDSDQRFSINGLRKLIFTPAEPPMTPIGIEVLPVGSLGLPQKLLIESRENINLPVLRANVLVLTKVKRASQWIGSTRPRSLIIMQKDESDIAFLMNVIAADNDKIDFVGYNSANAEKLYAACKDIVHQWKRTKKEDLVELMSSILNAKDRERVMEC